MQTFLPYPSMHDSLMALDKVRLNKQILEVTQILNALEYGSAWENHPAVKMWEGFEPALERYHDVALKIWERRGGGGDRKPYERKPHQILPWWWGFEPFHEAHRANLLRKQPGYYKSYDWFNVNPDMFYLWPVNCENGYGVFRVVVPAWAKKDLGLIRLNKHFHEAIADKVVYSDQKRIGFRTNEGYKFYMPSRYNLIFEKRDNGPILFNPIKM